jgi:hypothetical protein
MSHQEKLDVGPDPLQKIEAPVRRHPTAQLPSEIIQVKINRSLPSKNPLWPEESTKTKLMRALSAVFKKRAKTSCGSCGDGGGCSHSAPKMADSSHLLRSSAKSPLPIASVKDQIQSSCGSGCDCKTASKPSSEAVPERLSRGLAGSGSTTLDGPQSMTAYNAVSPSSAVPGKRKYKNASRHLMIPPSQAC